MQSNYTLGPIPSMIPPVIFISGPTSFPVYSTFITERPACPDCGIPNFLIGEIRHDLNDPKRRYTRCHNCYRQWEMTGLSVKGAYIPSPKPPSLFQKIKEWLWQ